MSHKKLYPPESLVTKPVDAKFKHQTPFVSDSRRYLSRSTEKRLVRFDSVSDSATHTVAGILAYVAGIWWQNDKTITNRSSKQNQISQAFGFRHNRKPAWLWLEISSTSLLMWRRPNQRRQRSLHPFTLNATNSNEWILHRWSHHVQTVRRIRCWTTSVIASTSIFV